MLYAAYGLNFDSHVDLPWANALSAPRPVDVEIRLGPVSPPNPPAGDGFWTIESRERIVMEWQGVRLRAEDGRRAILDAPDGVAPQVMQILAAFAAPTMLLHQRAALPVHASSAAGPAGGAIFIGDAGAGKSTFAALMTREGWAMSGDDLAALDLAGPSIGVHRAIPAARLFADASAAIDEGGVETEKLRRRGVGLGKALHRFDDAAVVAWPAPLRAVFDLQWLHPSDAEPEVELLPRLTALSRLRAAVARREYVAPLGLDRRYFLHLARIVATVPVFALRRPRRFEAAAAAARLARDTVERLSLLPAAEERADQ